MRLGKSHEVPFLTALYVMAYRQLKSFLRMKVRILISVGRPMMWLFFFGVGWSASLRGPLAQEALEGMGFMDFMVPGVAMMSVFFSAFFAGSSVIWDREFGFLKEVLVAPASRKAIILGRVLGDSIIALLQGIITLAVASPFVSGLSLLGVLQALLAMFLTALAYASLGTAIGSIVSNVETFQLIHVTLAMPMMFLSGAVVPLYQAPSWMRMAALAVPLTYGVDMARSGMTSVELLPTWLDLAVLSCLAIAFLLLAVKAFERTKPR
ncbi:MAG TPA: ABC transporter [Candidatus Bathyarchaeota archaeon]|nr:ABC transporter [Candidatus Bathyarchaeota archaeon]